MKLTRVALMAAMCCVGATNPSNAPPVIRLNVAVLDASGRSAEGLTSADFRVSDAGKPQAMVFARRSPVQPVLVLLDLFNTTTSDLGTLIKEATEALHATQAKDRIYLYLLTHEGKVKPVHALPSTEAEAAEPGGVWASQAGELLRKVLEDVNTSKRTNFTTGQRVSFTFDGLESLGARLAAVPGHKNLLWVTRGVPIGFREKSRGE